MKDSIINKLKIIKEQYHSIGKQLSDEATQKNNKLMVELSKELSRIEPVVKLFEEYLTQLSPLIQSLRMFYSFTSPVS